MSVSPGFRSAPNSVHVDIRSDVQIAEGAVTEVQLSRDVCPLTDFRANAATFIERVRRTGQPIIITQHGRSSAVLLGIESYESLLAECELLRDVRSAEDEVAAGLDQEHTRVEVRLRGLLGR